MRIDRLKLLNFKGFSELDQRLNRRFTLIVGNNGVGKSSLLDALSIAFGSFMLGIPDVAMRHVNQSEVREFERDFDGTPEFNHAYPVMVEAEGRITHPVSGEAKDVCWTRALGSKNGRTTTKDARAFVDRGRGISGGEGSGQSHIASAVLLWNRAPLGRAQGSQEKDTTVTIRCLPQQPRAARVADGLVELAASRKVERTRDGTFIAAAHRLAKGR